MRVNLRVIKEGRMEVGHMVRLLMQSARQEKRLPLYDWRGYWERIVVALRGVEPRPHHFEADEAALMSMMDSGSYVVHHSRRFNEAYGPHYRLVRRDLFEQEILPLLEEEPFRQFWDRFASECDFQRGRIAPVVLVLADRNRDVAVVNREPVLDTATLEGSYWECSVFPKERCNWLIDIMPIRPNGKAAVRIRLEDTGVMVDWVFERREGKWYLCQTEDYSM